MLQIIIPLSIPVIMVISLYYAVGHWNSFFPALIYLRDSKKFPLQLVLRELLIQNEILIKIPFSLADISSLTCALHAEAPGHVFLRYHIQNYGGKSINNRICGKRAISDHIMHAKKLV